MLSVGSNPRSLIIVRNQIGYQYLASPGEIYNPLKLDVTLTVRTSHYYIFFFELYPSAVFNTECRSSP